MSHPMWVRGLKRKQYEAEQAKQAVAPYVGAWIETKYFINDFGAKEVAPYVGAWIETADIWRRFSGAIVAPYVGAWIETRKHNQKTTT